MTPAPGTRLGSYEITAKLGEGGMGEVYRATDTRLKRDVAIKVLPVAFTEDKERLARFEREAHLLAQLNHPNIAHIYGLETSGETLALVMELVDGPTLAERLESGSLPLDESLRFARQIAEALEEAHEKGIIHRDLKPQNIKISREGNVKVLDFGLAKAMDAGSTTGISPHDLAHSPTMTFGGTREGIILGTAAYMAPEQARGGALDKRADIWAFGVVLYEMLSGERLFAEGSVVDTLSAVMRKEIDLARLPPTTPARLRELVRRCLERDPRRRLRDIGEARFLLGEPLDSALAPTPLSPPALARQRRFALPIAVASIALVAAALIAVLAKRPPTAAPPSFQQLTFRRGTVTGARFTPDGESIVYSAQWGEKASEIFSVRATSPESRPLALADATLLAVSANEELAVKLRPKLWSGQFHGTLARVPFGGGEPREVEENIQEADWAPDGSSLALVRVASGQRLLEFPAGKVLYDESSSRPTGVRISPDGQRIALAEGGFFAARSLILALGLDGRKQVLAEVQATGLAWAASGKEVWFSQDDAGGASSLWAVDLAGKRRLLARHAGSIVLRDVSKDGVLLVSFEHPQYSVLFRAAGEARERDLAWLDGTQVFDISADGRTLLLNEIGIGGGQEGAFYLRNTDGSPAVRLGNGFAFSLSPDGRWVSGRRFGQQDRVLLVPTGAGQAKTIQLPFVAGQAWFFPDGRRLLVNVSLPDGKPRIFSMDPDGSHARQLAPDGFDNFIGENAISPDGQWIDAGNSAVGDLQLKLFPTGGSLVARSVPGFEPDDAVIRWAADSHSLFVFKRNELPARVFRLDLATGVRTPWLELMPADPAGVTRIRTVVMTADGRSYAYNVARTLSDLYLVRGIH